MSKDIQKESNKKEKSFKEFISNSVWGIKQLFKLAPLELSIEIAMTSLNAFLPIINAWVYSKFIDILTFSISNHTNGDILSLSNPITFYALISAISTCAGYLINDINGYIVFRFNEYYFPKYYHMVSKQIAGLDIQQYEDPELANSIRKAKNNAWKIRNFSIVFFRTLLTIVGMITGSIILFKELPLLILIAMIIVLPDALVWADFSKKYWAFYDKNTEKWRIEDGIVEALTEEKNIPENRITSNRDRLFNKLRATEESIFKEISKIRTRSTILSDLFVVFDFIREAFVPLYIIQRVISQGLSIGYFTFYTNRALSLSGQFKGLADQMVDLYDSGQALSDLKKIMELEPAIKSGNVKLNKSVTPTIEFKNVWFKYPKGKRWVLKNLNMLIKPSEEIAIVGENGAGKSTIIKLILRFYDVTKGSILINGHSIQDLDLNSYYDLIGALFQDYNIYKFTDIKENITIGKRKNSLSLKIEQAIKFADAEKFIKNLDNGFKQIISKNYEEGTNLSTGQQQKLALARMFYRNSPILILDEPTASIDAVSEYKIFNRIYKFMNNKTVIIISHRFSTVRNAKKIYVIENGKITEEGSHEQLMKLSGKYASAFKLQAEGYQQNDTNSLDLDQEVQTA